MNTPVTPKTHPAGTRFIADGGPTSLNGLYELTVLEWSKEGNIKVQFPNGSSGWLQKDKIPASVEILVKGKHDEDKLEELHKQFDDFFKKAKTAGTAGINDICDAASHFLKNVPFVFFETEDDDKKKK